MNKWKRLLDVRGTKYAYLGLAMIANLVWVLLFFSGVDWVILSYADITQGLDTTLMLGVFLGALTIAFFITQIANDGRGVTYGLYGGFAGMLIAVLATYASGLLAALVGLMAILGGFNGGTLGEGLRRVRQQNK